MPYTRTQIAKLLVLLALLVLPRDVHRFVLEALSFAHDELAGEARRRLGEIDRCHAAPRPEDTP